jgi:hypothetical protein
MKASFIFTFWIVNVKCVKKEGKREGGEGMVMTSEKERKARRKRQTRTHTHGLRDHSPSCPQFPLWLLAFCGIFCKFLIGRVTDHSGCAV